jgi:hypothetical protein
MPLRHHRGPAAATTSKVHAPGFTAVSRRFHRLAWMLGDPYCTAIRTALSHQLPVGTM